MGIKKGIYLCIGFVALALGSIGAVVPLLPTVPFFLLAAACFGRGSTKLHTWFCGTKLYETHLKSYHSGEGMSRKAKRSIMVTVTLLLMVGFVMMNQVPLGQGVLGVVWLAHLIYFFRVVPTKEA